MAATRLVLLKCVAPYRVQTARSRAPSRPSTLGRLAPAQSELGGDLELGASFVPIARGGEAAGCEFRHRRASFNYRCSLKADLRGNGFKSLGSSAPQPRAKHARISAKFENFFYSQSHEIRDGDQTLNARIWRPAPSRGSTAPQHHANGCQSARNVALLEGRRLPSSRSPGVILTLQVTGDSPFDCSSESPLTYVPMLRFRDGQAETKEPK